jgi:hypothetical protein
MKTQRDIEIKIAVIEKDMADLKRKGNEESAFAVELLEFSIETLKWVLSDDGKTN